MREQPHLLLLLANRARVTTGWALDTVLPRQSVRFGLVRGPAVPLSPAPRDDQRELATVPGGGA